ncbi:hypothetical protein EFN10_10305, partial [Propionibacterium freudenreichii]|nr:hypothetical protein [Propionibacterium freudenreichii]
RWWRQGSGTPAARIVATQSADSHSGHSAVVPGRASRWSTCNTHGSPASHCGIATFVLPGGRGHALSSTTLVQQRSGPAPFSRDAARAGTAPASTAPLNCAAPH